MLEWETWQLLWQRGGKQTLSRHQGEHVTESLKAADIPAAFSEEKLRTKTGTGREMQPKQPLTVGEWYSQNIKIIFRHQKVENVYFITYDGSLPLLFKIFKSL